jgi:hypothetical protein
MLKDIELIGEINLRHAYHDALIRVPFEEVVRFELSQKTNQNENNRTT